MGDLFRASLQKDKLKQLLTQQDESKRTPLLYASDFHSSFEIIQTLLNELPDDKVKHVIQASPFNQCTPLHHASSRNRVDIAELLLNVFTENEFDKMSEYINTKNRNGKTAIDIAIRNGYGNFAQFLREKEDEIAQTNLGEVKKYNSKISTKLLNKKYGQLKHLIKNVGQCLLHNATTED